LSPKGHKEAQEAANQLSRYVYDIDACFTSILSRAQSTLQTCLQALPRFPHTIHVDYRLSERHYGALQGLSKQDVEDGLLGYTDPQLVHQWRRSWSIRPPLLNDKDPRRLAEVQYYADVMPPDAVVPNAESLAMVARDRVRPWMNEVLTPTLNAYAWERCHVSSTVPTTATGLVMAHANSLRALLGVLCEVEEDSEALRVLEAIRIPTGVPLVIQYQQLANGRYRACPLPEADECVIHYDDGALAHPPIPPPHFGHPKLPVWPLDVCIPWSGNHERNTAPALSVQSGVVLRR
jgi:2,3-bisphosphoglycerate-dependent phosphoglycerate mutase